MEHPAADPASVEPRESAQDTYYARFYLLARGFHIGLLECGPIRRGK